MYTFFRVFRYIFQKIRFNVSISIFQHFRLHAIYYKTIQEKHLDIYFYPKRFFCFEIYTLSYYQKIISIYMNEQYFYEPVTWKQFRSLKSVLLYLRWRMHRNQQKSEPPSHFRPFRVSLVLLFLILLLLFCMFLLHKCISCCTFHSAGTRDQAMNKVKRRNELQALALMNIHRKK